MKKIGIALGVCLAGYTVSCSKESESSTTRGSSKLAQQADQIAEKKGEKGERGEQLIEAFRTELVELANATTAQNITRVCQVQKTALLALGAYRQICCIEAHQ